MVFTLLGQLLVWCSSIPCEKTSTQNFLPFFLWCDITGTRIIFLLPFSKNIKLFLHEQDITSFPTHYSILEVLRNNHFDA
jgi:hypothetical protein